MDCSFLDSTGLFYGWAGNECRWVFSLTFIFFWHSHYVPSSPSLFYHSFFLNKDACSGDGTSNIPINPVAPLGTMISVLYNTNPASVDTYILAELMLYYFVSVE